MSPLRGAAVLLLALTLATSATASAPDTVSRPQWTTGDRWTYQTNTTLTPGLNLTGPVTTTVAGRKSVIIQGVTVDAYHVLLSGSGVAAGTRATGNGTITIAGAWILTGEELLEPTSLNVVSSVLDLSVNGSLQLAIPVPFSLRVQNTTTFRILQDSWQYPLRVGTAGAVAMRFNYTQDLYGLSGTTDHTNGSGQWTLNYSMSSPVSVASGAGTFSAFPILERWPDGSFQRLLFSPDVGNAVRTESYGADGNLTAVTSLVSYRYQALESPTFLGLTALQWTIAAPIIVAVAVATVLWVRRRRRRGTTPRAGLPPPGP